MLLTVISSTMCCFYWFVWPKNMCSVQFQCACNSHDLNWL